MEVDDTSTVGDHEIAQNRNSLRPISAMPLLRPSRVATRVQADLPYPLQEPHVSYWYNGRAATWHGLAALGLKPGDRVLAPAYCCGSEIDTLLKAGLELTYYRVNSDLSVNFEHLAELSEQSNTPALKALFITHFFGFPQPLDALSKFARDHDLLLIEDVCHGLFSSTSEGVPLGSVGDMAVFSLWKTLGIPNGGVLQLASPEARAKVQAERQRPGLMSNLGQLRHMVEEATAYRFPNMVKHLRHYVTNPLEHALHKKGSGPYTADSPTVSTNTPNESSPERMPEADQVMFHEERRSWGMSQLSEFLVPRVASPDVPAQRRQNYEHLAARMSNPVSVKMVLPELPRGACPLFFPILVQNPKPFAKYLAAQSIGFFRVWCVFHPNIPWADFEMEAYLKENVLVLPIHQDVTPDDIERMANVVNHWRDPLEGGAWPTP